MAKKPATQPPQDGADPKPEAETLVVCSRRLAGWRRAGRRFGPAETVISLAELSSDDLAAIESDPELIVRFV